VTKTVRFDKAGKVKFDVIVGIRQALSKREMEAKEVELEIVKKMGKPFDEFMAAHSQSQAQADNTVVAPQQPGIISLAE